MKISKSKVTLAAKIKSSGFEWPQFGKWAAQDKDGEIFISGGDFTPVRMSGEVNWEFDAPYKSAGKVEVGLNWFQCILSRDEYLHLYPAPDDDGWVEWKGGECPVGGDVMVVCKVRTGKEFRNGKKIKASILRWRHTGGMADIISYRLHKPEQAKPEFCESVMRSIPEPEAKPTIEQLAADYRNKLDYANRKQDEADKANMESDAALAQLEDAIAEIGFVITPLAATEKEPELVITDWRDLQVGDLISWSIIGHIGEFRIISVHHDPSRNIGDFEVEDKQGGVYRVYGNECKFIRRP